MIKVVLELTKDEAEAMKDYIGELTLSHFDSTDEVTGFRNLYREVESGVEIVS